MFASGLFRPRPGVDAVAGEDERRLPIVFANGHPTHRGEARGCRKQHVPASGPTGCRSAYPNQTTTSSASPGPICPAGSLDAVAPRITEEIKLRRAARGRRLRSSPTDYLGPETTQKKRKSSHRPLHATVAGQRRQSGRREASKVGPLPASIEEDGNLRDRRRRVHATDGAGPPPYLATAFCRMMGIWRSTRGFAPLLPVLRCLQRGRTLFALPRPCRPISPCLRGLHRQGLPPATSQVLYPSGGLV